MVWRNRLLGLLGASLLVSGVEAAPIVDPIPAAIAKGGVVVELETVAAGLAAPNTLTHAGDGTDRLFVVDQTGQIRLIEAGSLVATPFLDLSARLTPPSLVDAERGFLGLAFHPGFGDSGSPGFGKIYTYTSEPVDGIADFTPSDPLPGAADHQSVLAEWQVDAGNPNAIDVSTRREILRIDQPQPNHNAGALVFGPDGLLYVSLGDGGNADDQGTGHGASGNGQDTSNVYGSILRIDPDGTNAANAQYGVPADNPFVGVAGVDEIYAYGFRNPFRLSFDALTGDLIAADVGQADIEEIDIVLSGENYGWNLKEGSFAFDPNGAGAGFVTDSPVVLPPDLVDPVAEYDHDEGSAVIGGFVYRGSAIPDLVGKYVFGDLDGRLFYADLVTGLIRELVLGLDDRNLLPFVLGFGEDASGELYLLSAAIPGPFFTTGLVRRIVPALPEPSLALLMMCGTIGLGILQRRATTLASQ